MTMPVHLPPTWNGNCDDGQAGWIRSGPVRRVCSTSVSPFRCSNQYQQRYGAGVTISVLGAGGRAGRAISAAAVSPGHDVSAVVRDIHRHPGLSADRISLVTGDARDPGSVAQAGTGSTAIVSAVTPFTAPPASFDGFDIGYYERVATALAEGAAWAGVGRLVIIGLFATLRTPDGGLVLNDPALFPEALRPFARAHLQGVERLRALGSPVDLLILAPPPGLSTDVEPTGRYRLGTGTVERESWMAPGC